MLTSRANFDYNISCFENKLVARERGGEGEMWFGKQAGVGCHTK